MYFYNVVNLLIKHIKINACGGFLSEVVERMHFAVIFIHHCSDVGIVDVNICNPKGYGILASKVVGKNNLENLAVIPSRLISDLSHPAAHSSFGLLWDYEAVADGIMRSNDQVIICINNISLIYANTHYSVDVKMLEFVIRHYNVFISIKNSAFLNLHDIITIKITVSSLSLSSIYFHNCYLNMSNIKHHVYVLHSVNWFTHNCGKLDVTFAETVFSANMPYPDCSILKFEEPFKCGLNITFSEVKFYGNLVPLLQVLLATHPPSPSHNQQIVLIFTEGYFIVEENRLSTKSPLISLQHTKMQFNKITKFIKNKLTDEMLHLSLSMLSFSNDTLFNRNVCSRLFFFKLRNVLLDPFR